MQPVVILGTGLAGYSLAREIRKLDGQLPLRLITADDGRAYSKPMLSNALSKGKGVEQLATATAAEMAAQLNANIDSDCRVQRIDRDSRTVITDQGNIRYDRLVLALGADPIRLPFAGDAADTPLSINDLGDYAVFRERLRPGAHVLIMGAGLIGCEFANDLALTGHRVSVIDPASGPLGRLLPEPSARMLADALRSRGVSWHFGVSAERIEQAGRGYSVTLSDGQELAVDLVLSAIGLRPRKTLAEEAGLECGRGIVVDRHLETSQPGIFALGDCAEICGLVLPFVMPIMHAARALAKTLCGTPTAVTFPAMPVVVKTPSCPVVLSPPPRERPGNWAIEEVAGGIIARYLEPDGRLAGFVLTGSGTGHKQQLTRELPELLA